MPMSPQLNRRRFLRGSGVVLALPWLPSLPLATGGFAKEAHA